MQIRYRNKGLERLLIAVNILACAAVAASFVCLFGYEKPLLPENFLYVAQFVLLFIFIIEKALRFINAESRPDFTRANWFELPLFILLIIILVSAWVVAGRIKLSPVQNTAVCIYLVLQVVTKSCRTVVNMAAAGRNPTKTMALSFLVLIFVGSSLLTLPKAGADRNVPISFIDALFTATSATCVTGLTAKNPGSDFSLMGQLIILTLIQLGGLGIVIFGAVFALLLGQALTLRESGAMQDLLSTQTLSKIGNMIAFIFGFTILIETIGALSLFGTWNTDNIHDQWFYSVFHSISAFCNAGLSLFDNSFIQYNRSWQIYIVVCPLIILGGLGFSVLYDIANICTDKAKLLYKRFFQKQSFFADRSRRQFRLQSKIVLTVSAVLIILGAGGIFLFEHYSAGAGESHSIGILDSIFQSVTARTAGFNTVDIGQLSASSRFVLILLMFVGGSPGSTAGGIKTVTLAVIVMSVLAALRKRQEVEIFRRSVRLAIVGRAITVTMLFVLVLFTAIFALSITERANGFDLSQISFEASSALGTVGLSTGITPHLTTAGKLIIIAVMLIGRLGPMTLLASLAFNIKPARYNYPEEAIIVG